MPRLSALLVLLLCTILLVVRSMDMHVHLCFDGQEAPVSVHFEDGAELNEHLTEITLQHHDLDVDVVSHLSSKPSKLNLPLVVLTFAVLLLAVSFLGKPPLAIRRSLNFRYRSRPYFTPPLRGPPIHSVS
jgi:hypothetical protein